MGSGSSKECSVDKSNIDRAWIYETDKPLQKSIRSISLLIRTCVPPTTGLEIAGGLRPR